MRAIFLSLAIVLGGCAAGYVSYVDKNQTRRGFGVFPPVDPVGVKDANTRRKYADACSEVKTPAECLFALSMGANPEAARLVFRRGGNVCWRQGGTVCYPFVASARGMVPTGAQYDVSAVNSESQPMFALLSSGPDIVRPRLAHVERATVEESALPPDKGRGNGGSGTDRSGDAGITPPRAVAGPREPGAPASNVAPQSDRCGEYAEIQRQYQDALAAFKKVLQNGDVAKAQEAFGAASRILRGGISSCATDKEVIGALRRALAQLNKLGKQAGFIQEI